MSDAQTTSRKKSILGPIIGFTLLAGLLFAILFPVFATARMGGGSRSASCFRNLRHIATSSEMYFADNEALPPTHDWQASLLKYMKTSDMYACPGLHRLKEPVGYAMNERMGGVRTEVGWLSWIPLFFDTENLVPNATSATLSGTRRHGGGVTIAFGDGQARYVPAGGLNRFDMAPTSGIAAIHRRSHPGDSSPSH